MNSRFATQIDTDTLKNINDCIEVKLYLKNQHINGRISDTEFRNLYKSVLKKQRLINHLKQL